MRTTEDLGRWEGASTEEKTAEPSSLTIARKLFADLARSLDREIDRIEAALAFETDEQRIDEMIRLVRLTQKTLQTVLDMEARCCRQSGGRDPEKGVIDLAQARAEIARRLARLAR